MRYLLYIISVVLAVSVGTAADNKRDPRSHRQVHRDPIGHVVNKENEKTIKGSCRDTLIDLKSKHLNEFWQGCLEKKLGKADNKKASLKIEEKLPGVEKWHISNIAQNFTELGYSTLSASPAKSARRVKGVKFSPKYQQFAHFLDSYYQGSGDKLPESMSGDIIVPQSSEVGNVFIAETLGNIVKFADDLENIHFLKFKDSKTVTGLPDDFDDISVEERVDSSLFDIIAIANWIKDNQDDFDDKVYVVCDPLIAGLLRWAIEAVMPGFAFTMFMQYPASYQTVMHDKFIPSWSKNPYEAGPITMGWAHLAHLAKAVDWNALNIRNINRLRNAQIRAKQKKQKAAKKKLKRKRKKQKAVSDKRLEEEQKRKVEAKKAMLMQQLKDLEEDEKSGKEVADSDDSDSDDSEDGSSASGDEKEDQTEK